MKSKKQVKNVQVVEDGNQITIPPGMTYDEAIKWLARKKEENEKAVAIYHELDGHPLDCAVAFHKALAHLYGWTNLVPTPGFWEDKPPCMIGVKVGLDETVQIPWGRVQVPNISGYIETGIGNERFYLGGQTKQKHNKAILEIVKTTERILRTDSIYKGNAVKVNYQWKRDDLPFHPIAHAPKFMPLTGVKEDDLIFGDEVSDALTIGLFAPIEYPAACRSYEVPLKRGVLLFGPYGVGKSLTATVTAIKGVRNGFTFIYIESVLDLEEGLKMAAGYSPAIVFCEDIDRSMHGDRSIGMDAILNILDGVNTKGAEIITVFTTNNVMELTQAMLRPGRLDALVEIKPPDAVAAARLVRLYGRGLFSPDTDFEAIGEALAGYIPALIREVTERAKISAIYRLRGGNIEGKVQSEDLLGAVAAMKNHMDMLQPRKAELVLDTVNAPVVRELVDRLAPSLLLGNGNAKK